MRNGTYAVPAIKQTAVNSKPKLKIERRRRWGMNRLDQAPLQQSTKDPSPPPFLPPSLPPSSSSHRVVDGRSPRGRCVSCPESPGSCPWPPCTISTSPPLPPWSWRGATPTGRTPCCVVRIVIWYICMHDFPPIKRNNNSRPSE